MHLGDRYSYLNDVKEREHCIEMMKLRLPEFIKGQSQASAKLIKSSLKSIEGVLSSFDNFETQHPYVASFSRDGDSLPQWRAYCPNGNGVSIGFRVAALKRTTLWKEPGTEVMKATLSPIRYLADDDPEMVDTLLAEWLQNVESFQKHMDRFKDQYPEGDAA